MGGYEIVNELVAGTDTSAAVYYQTPPPNANDEEQRAYIGGLPSPEYWLVDPRHHKLEVYVDEWGQIDSGKLIQDVLSTIDPVYNWPGYTSRHHKFWAEARYARIGLQIPESRAKAFRNLPDNIDLYPRVFHNWLHLITEQPVMPDPVIMSERVREWDVVRGVHENLRIAARLARIIKRERESGLTEQQREAFKDEMLVKLRGLVSSLMELQDLPLERWPFDVNLGALDAISSIGDHARHGCRLRTRDVRRPDLLRRVA